MSEETQRVRHFRQILLWPVQLIPLREGAQIQKHWEALEHAGADNPWHEVADEFGDEGHGFQERHYGEFVTFLPQVQRFLYGEGLSREPGRAAADSPIRVFRRRDVARLRLVHTSGADPVEFQVARVDLHFFYDIDVMVLALEIHADDLPLAVAQDTLYRFGRAYPPRWEADGSATHCPARAQWLAADGRVLATSDFEDKAKFLGFVGRHRAPCIAAHWEFLLRPLALHPSEQPGLIRYRQIEYYRMPLMAYLALDEPRALARADWVRLGLVGAPGGSEALPYSERHLRGFEHRYCYDRYWSEAEGGPDTRFLCCGHALVLVGNARRPFFTDLESGVLGQFRHQYFLLFLIAHFHKSSLLMLSDRLVAALNRLEIHQPETVKRFKRTIRQVFEIFLRFNHRYWFHDISDQVQARELFRLCSEHLGSDRLFEEVRQEIQDMSDYLDSDSLRRQANTVVRLTVVTTFGLIATVTTGFLGMNLLDAASQPLTLRIALFVLVAVPTIALVFYAVARSKRLSDFLEDLSDERLRPGAKLASLLSVWRKRPRA